MKELPERQADGDFDDFQTWVNKATSWIGGTNSLCADSIGRICASGGDMMRARDEGTFPVRFWFGEGPVQSGKEKRKAERVYSKAMKLHYPWRFK